MSLSKGYILKDLKDLKHISIKTDSHPNVNPHSSKFGPKEATRHERLHLWYQSKKFSKFQC